MKNTDFKKTESVFLNTDSKSYNTYIKLKQKLVNQNNIIIELELRIKRLEDLVLN